MSKEHAKELLEKLESDPSFKKALQNATPEEAKKIIEANHLECTKEEVVEAYTNMVGRELNEQELTQVAAGVIPGALGGTDLYQP